MITSVEILPLGARNYERNLILTLTEKLDIKPNTYVVNLVIQDKRFEKLESLEILIDLEDLKKAIEKLAL
jgi:hypothetical protein